MFNPDTGLLNIEDLFLKVVLQVIHTTGLQLFAGLFFGVNIKVHVGDTKFRSFFPIIFIFSKTANFD